MKKSTYYKQNKVFGGVITLMLLFIGLHHASAAVISVIPEKETVAQGEMFQLDVYIDSGDVSINTVRGTIALGDSVSRVEKIITGNSVVTLWMEQPMYHEDTQKIDFAGMIPGGLVTNKGYLFSVVLSKEALGEHTINPESVQVLLNDGAGTNSVATYKNAKITITPGDSASGATFTDQVDHIPPEKFTITRTRDGSVFDGNWFLVFSSQDKGSGIKKYEVCESLLGVCKEQTSPYKLTHQSNWYYVVVHAYDEHNNIRTSSIASKNIKWVFVITILCCILVSTYALFSRNKKKFFR